MCKIDLCSLGTDFQALLFFISVVSFKFTTLVFPLYSSFHAFFVVALLLGSHLVSPFQRQAELWQGAAQCCALPMITGTVWLGLFCQKDFSLGEHSAGAAQHSWLFHLRLQDGAKIKV